MTFKARLVGCVGAAALVAFSASVLVRANGAEFFEAENDGKVVLFYFGNIRDGKGNPIALGTDAKDKLLVTITAKNAGLTFPFRGDQPGHFRSIDIGKAIEAAGQKVDPAQIEITITKPGYRIVSAPKVPNKMGPVQLDAFVLEPVAGAKK